MKKFILIVCILFLSADIAAAQSFGFGPRVGINASKITKGGKEARAGLNVGVFAGIDFSKLGIEVAAMFSQQGANYKYVYNYEEFDAKMKLNYINIPVVVKYNLIGGLDVFLGPQFSALVSAKTKSEKITVNVKDAFKRGDVGGIVGLDYQFRLGLNIGVNYSFGFLKTDRKSYDISSSFFDKGDLQTMIDRVNGKNGAWQLTFGWRF